MKRVLVNLLAVLGVVENAPDDGVTEAVDTVEFEVEPVVDAGQDLQAGGLHGVAVKVRLARRAVALVLETVAGKGGACKGKKGEEDCSFHNEFDSETDDCSHSS